MELINKLYFSFIGSNLVISVVAVETLVDNLIPAAHLFMYSGQRLGY